MDSLHQDAGQRVCLLQLCSLFVDIPAPTNVSINQSDFRVLGIQSAWLLDRLLEDYAHADEAPPPDDGNNGGTVHSRPSMVADCATKRARERRRRAECIICDPVVGTDAAGYRQHAYDARYRDNKNLTSAISESEKRAKTLTDCGYELNHPKVAE